MILQRYILFVTMTSFFMFSIKSLRFLGSTSFRSEWQTFGRFRNRLDGRCWITKFLTQSRHKPPHRLMHDGDSRGGSRRPQRRCGAGGSGGACQNDGERLGMCKRTDNQGNPSGNNGTQLSGSPHRRGCCGPPTASPR